MVDFKEVKGDREQVARYERAISSDEVKITHARDELRDTSAEVGLTVEQAQAARDAFARGKGSAQRGVDDAKRSFEGVERSLRRLPGDSAKGLGGADKRALEAVLRRPIDLAAPWWLTEDGRQVIGALPAAAAARWEGYATQVVALHQQKQTAKTKLDELHQAFDQDARRAANAEHVLDLAQTIDRWIGARDRDTTERAKWSRELRKDLGNLANELARRAEKAKREAGELMDAARRAEQDAEEARRQLRDLPSTGT